MDKVYFGANMSIPVRPGAREKAERFIETVLKCKKSFYDDSYTCYHFPNGQIFGLTPRADAPTEEEYEKSIWLECVADDFESTKKAAIEFGVREVQGGMLDAFFFNIPGGPVVRLVERPMLEKEESPAKEKMTQQTNH